MKTLVITGTPGTGKTFLAKKLSLLLRYAYVDVGNALKKAGLVTSYDCKRRCYVVDEALLPGFLEKVRLQAEKKGERGLILDSHLAHFLTCKRSIRCIVAVCSDLKLLKRRLASRRYSVAKVRENMDAEIFQVCLTEAQERGYTPVLFDSARPSKTAIHALAKKLRK